MNINDVCVCVWVIDFGDIVSTCIHYIHVFAAFDSLPRQMYGFIDSSENDSRAMLYGHWQVMRIMRKIAVDDRDHFSLFMSRCFFLCMSTSYIIFGGQILNETEYNMMFTTFCWFLQCPASCCFINVHLLIIFLFQTANVAFPIKKQHTPRASWRATIDAYGCF